MRKRNYRIVIHVNEEELEFINQKANQLKISREKYIREACKNVKMIIPPPIDYRHLINEFNHIGTNLNQLTRIANATNSIQENQLNQLISEFHFKIKELDSIIHYGHY